MKQVTAILLAGLFLLMGCQAKNAPLEAAQKNTDQIVIMASENQQANLDVPVDAKSGNAEELRAYYGVPERYVATLTGADGKLTVRADITLTLPGVMGMPVARVEAADFSQEQATKAFRYFCDSIPMIKQPETENAQPIPVDGTLEERSMYADGPDSDKVIGNATGLYAVSEAVDPSGMRTTFSVSNNGEYTLDSSYGVEYESGNLFVIAPRMRSVMHFLAARATHGYNALYIINDPTYTNVTALAKTGDVPEGCIMHTTPRQAKEMTQALMDALEMDDFVIAGVYLYSSKSTSPEDWPMPTPKLDGSSGGPAEPIDEPERQMYSVRLLRTVNGVKVESSEDEIRIRVSGMDYAPIWDSESCYINIDDSGVTYFGWLSPHTVTNIEIENAALIPWEQVQEIFEKTAVVKYSATAKKEYNHSVLLDITRVELCLQRIIEQGSYTAGLLVPVWNFYGDTTITRTNVTETYKDPDRLPLISINAIDGSIIDVAQGY